jgi:hypothetical protein
MASSTPNTILLEVNGGPVAERRVHEAVVVTTAVTPGDLLIWSSGSITPSTTAADTDCPTIFAVENPYLDPLVATSPAIDTDYAVAAVARYVYPMAGDVVYGWLETGANVAKGAALESSDVDGCLQAFTSGRIIGFADEAKDNSGGGAPVRVKVRIA